MAMRNWWINAVIDGRKSDLCGGPRSKDGEFYLTVRQRNNGVSVDAVSLSGYVNDSEEGEVELVLRVEICPGLRTTIDKDDGSFTIKTQR